ncbi:MAG: hypothetical protein LZF62_430084 [Nitrospira sp.]|nr:MAG: hypothetical protein LZF62_430084 [Nitrospira sp.]
MIRVQLPTVITIRRYVMREAVQVLADRGVSARLFTSLSVDR